MILCVVSLIITDGYFDAERQQEIKAKRAYEKSKITDVTAAIEKLSGVFIEAKLLLYASKSRCVELKYIFTERGAKRLIDI